MAHEVLGRTRQEDARKSRDHVILKEQPLAGMVGGHILHTQMMVRPDSNTAMPLRC